MLQRLLSKKLVPSSLHSDHPALIPGRSELPLTKGYLYCSFLMSSSGVINVLYVVRKASQYSTRSRQKKQENLRNPCFQKKKLLCKVEPDVQRRTWTHFGTGELPSNAVLLVLTSRWTLWHKSSSDTALSPPAWPWLPLAALGLVPHKRVSEKHLLVGQEYQSCVKEKRGLDLGDALKRSDGKR